MSDRSYIVRGMLVVSDVAGTLVPPGSTEGRSCRAFFARLRARGAPYVIATSHSWGDLCELLPVTAPGAHYCVCADGAITLAPRESARPAVIARHVVCAPRSLSSQLGAALPGAVSQFVFLDDRCAYAV